MTHPLLLIPKAGGEDMPKIKLKQVRGEYHWGDKLFQADKIYDVDNRTAYYLIHNAKVAEEVQGEAENALPSFFEANGKTKIAMIRIGGIGDSLELASMASAVKRKYPDSHITLFVRDAKCHEIIKDNPVVDRVVLAGQVEWGTYVDAHILPKDYDIIYDSRYITKVIYKDEVKYAEDKKITDKRFQEWTDHFFAFPLYNNKISKKWGDTNRALALWTSNLKGGDEDLYMHLTPKDYDMTSLLHGEKYVTIHNGSDIARQTKQWYHEGWEQVVEYLNGKGYKVIQLGDKFEEKVKGAIDMTGKTSLAQTSALISMAKFHVDTEGGLVHIARAVRTRCVVLFAPTPVKFFGYDTNVNIESPSDCIGCWWENDMWWRECPKGYPMPVKCMREITPEMVIEGIEEVEKKEELEDLYDPNDINEDFAIKMKLDAGHYQSEPCQFDRVNTMMEMVKGQTVLEVGAGDGYCSSVLTSRGYDVMSVEISKIRLKRIKEQGLKAVWGDVNNLPFEDNSFDTVICGEVLEHIPSIAQGFSELERVCKPDGRIIISLPIAPAFRTIDMHMWGIDHHMILRNGKEDMIVLGFDRINQMVHGDGKGGEAGV